MLRKCILWIASLAPCECLLEMQNLQPQPRPTEPEFEFYQDCPEIHMHSNV